MFSRALLAIIAIFLVASITIYYFLGGFNGPQITIEEKSSVTLYGTAYQGKYQSDKAEEAFYKIRNAMEELPEAQFVIVNFPSETENEVSYFIGLNTANDPGIEGLRERNLMGFSKIIRIRFDKHNLVMPKPFKVRQMAEKMAGDQELQLLDYSIETYLGERELQIDFPAK